MDRYSYIIHTLYFSSFSQYLENYLWVNYTPEVSSNAFLMSICCIVNEKFRENVPAWEVRNAVPHKSLHFMSLHGDPTQLSQTSFTISNLLYLFGVYQVFKKEPSHFPFFFKCVMEAVLAGDEAGLTLKEQTVLLVFLDHCFNSLVCTTTLKFVCNFGNVISVMLLVECMRTSVFFSWSVISLYFDNSTYMI